MSLNLRPSSHYYSVRISPRINLISFFVFTPEENKVLFVCCSKQYQLFSSKGISEILKFVLFWNSNEISSQTFRWEIHLIPAKLVILSFKCAVGCPISTDNLPSSWICINFMLISLEVPRDSCFRCITYQWVRQWPWKLQPRKIS